MGLWNTHVYTCSLRQQSATGLQIPVADVDSNYYDYSMKEYSTLKQDSDTFMVVMTIDLSSVVKQY